MADRIQNQYMPTEVSPPGETLREILAERRISQTELANRMGRPEKTISEIINARAMITPQTSLELELVLGIPADFWNARERHYRGFLARRELDNLLRNLTVWTGKFPVREMARLGWIAGSNNQVAQAKSLLEFFGVASTNQWRSLFESYALAFRKPASFDVDEYALSAWLRAGMLCAEKLAIKSYNREAFLFALREARALTTKPPKIFQPEVVRLCADGGVVVAFVPELPRSRASGATMWIAPDRALIQLSLRYKSDDHLWFTFFHEAAHVLHHGKRIIFLETGDHVGDAEEEANRWATNFLIPADDYQHFVSQRRFGKRAICDFADALGIAPGIVVGRLQHDQLLPHTHCNDLKKRLRWMPIKRGQE